MPVKIEKVRVGDLVTWGTKVWNYEVTEFYPDGNLDLVYGQTRDVVYMLAEEVQRPSLKPGMWVRAHDADCLRLLSDSLCGEGPYVDGGRHGSLTCGSLTDWLPVASPQVEDKPAEHREDRNVASAADLESARKAFPEQLKQVRAKPTELCVRCRANPRRARECCRRPERKPLVERIGEVVDAYVAKQGDSGAANEPDLRYWDRCHQAIGRLEGTIQRYVRHPVVILRFAINGDGTEDWVVKHEVLGKFDRYFPTPLEAAEWAEEHLL